MVKRANNIAPKVAAIAVLISLLVYLRALSCGFVVLDDPLYVIDNPVIRKLDWDFFYSVFTNTYVNWWMPLTWISLAIDYHFWGLNPVGYHLTNIVLHAANSGLVVLIADRIIKWVGGSSEGSKLYPFVLLLAGLLWGIHPLRVESVAWVTERKDVLNGLFALGAILCYLRYVRLKESGRVQIFSRYYFLTLILFILSLMAKSVTVVLPAVLLVLDWYPLRRVNKVNIRSVLIEKIPFFVVAAVMAAATIFFIDEASYLVSNQNFPFVQRLVVSGNALFEYCRLLLYPLGIIPYYRIPDPIPVGYALKTVVFAALAGFCLGNAGKKSGRAAVLLCFVLLLLPVLAFFQNGDQSYAARFTYLPAVAPSIAVAFCFAALLKRYDNQSRSWRLVMPVLFGLLLFYGAITQRQIAVWDSSETMWNRVVAVDPSAIAYKERGWLFLSMGKYAAAAEDFTKALEDPLPVWRPYIYNLYAFRGEALSLAGMYDEAVQDLTTAINMLPHPVYYRLRGIAFNESGKTAEAENDFSKAGGEIAPLDWYWSKVETQK